MGQSMTLKASVDPVYVAGWGAVAAGDNHWFRKAESLAKDAADLLEVGS